MKIGSLSENKDLEKSFQNLVRKRA